MTGIIDRFAQTQSGGITSQLDCGSRSFDWRPHVRADGTVVFSHGPVTVNHSMSSAAAEVVAWAAEHASEAEDAFVLLIVSHCDSDVPGMTDAQCYAAAADALRAAGLVNVYIGDAGCAAASDWTLGAAMKAAALPRGGFAAATVNCPGSDTPNVYDDRLSCTGFINVTQGNTFEDEVSKCLTKIAPAELYACLIVVLGVVDVPDHFDCYLGDKSSPVPFQRLRDHNAEICAVPPPSAPGQRGILRSIMGCWAQNTQSTILSFLSSSSLLDDERRSNFNQMLAGWLAPGNATHAPLLKYVNLVGANNVCDGGPQLVAALRSRIPASWP